MRCSGGGGSRTPFGSGVGEAPGVAVGSEAVGGSPVGACVAAAAAVLATVCVGLITALTGESAFAVAGSKASEMGSAVQAASHPARNKISI